MFLELKKKGNIWNRVYHRLLCCCFIHMNTWSVDSHPKQLKKDRSVGLSSCCLGQNPASKSWGTTLDASEAKVTEEVWDRGSIQCFKIQIFPQSTLQTQHWSFQTAFRLDPWGVVSSVRESNRDERDFWFEQKQTNILEQQLELDFQLSLVLSREQTFDSSQQTGSDIVPVCCSESAADFTSH